MEGFENLNRIQRRALYLRFWENQTVFEIAQNLRLSWDEADDVINYALRVLRLTSTKRAG